MSEIGGWGKPGGAHDGPVHTRGDSGPGFPELPVFVGGSKSWRGVEGHAIWKIVAREKRAGIASPLVIPTTGAPERCVRGSSPLAGIKPGRQLFEPPPELGKEAVANKENSGWGGGAGARVAGPAARGRA